jgi:hypothetical protein
MSIPTGGFAALLVIATFALTSCGSDGGTATATTTVLAPATAAQTTTRTQTQTQASTPAATQTTTQKARTTPAPTTTAKAQTTTATKAPAHAKQAAACPSVDVGVRDGDIDDTFARVHQATNVACATAAVVVQQWGAQQIGAGSALLPDGWSCTKANTCSNGRSIVSFTLEFPPSED